MSCLNVNILHETLVILVYSSSLNIKSLCCFYLLSQFEMNVTLPYLLLIGMLLFSGASGSPFP